MARPTRILGLSFYYHDSAAALIVDGVVVAAAQEERFSRKKHDDAYPAQAISFCLRQAGISAADIDYVVFYDKPLLTFERLLKTYIATWPWGLFSFVFAMEAWLSKKLWVERRIRKELTYAGEIFFSEHHISHAASAFYCSPFEEAAVLTMDGVGEWDTTTIGYGSGTNLQLIESIHFPHSLGLLYSALTYYLGFKVNSAEYKVMGLAPYGDARTYAKEMRQLIELRDDGSFSLNRAYFAYEYSTVMTTKKLHALFGGPPRQPESPLTQKEKDIAAALQEVLEEAVLNLARRAKARTRSENLCLAGGVALNCVANGALARAGLFKNIYVQPAAGDAGGAIGAALYVYHAILGNPRVQSMPSPYLGTSYSDEEIQAYLDGPARALAGGELIVYRTLTEAACCAETARLIDEGAIIGWFQGSMEFGPRALGNRSILADARVASNWQDINRKIKFRESFRPFAPAVLAEDAQKYFDLPFDSPHMLFTAPANVKSIPAVMHVDGSSRVQTVRRADNEKFWKLLSAFKARTGCSVLINTSFNVRGEPLVESPADALRCFSHTGLDYLVLGTILISKSDNPALARAQPHRIEYMLD